MDTYRQIPSGIQHEPLDALAHIMVVLLSGFQNSISQGILLVM